MLVARSARDLRGIALLPWALDPQVDVDGKRRATPLSQKEFEAKILAYEKRLDELDDEQILASLTGVNFERRGDLLVVDVLEADGTWDQRKSMLMEQQLAAMERFSMLPGAPSTTAKKLPSPPRTPAEARGRPPAAAAAPKPEPRARAGEEAEPKGPPLAANEIDGKVVLVFPPERFDLDVAAALGKRDWDHVVRSSDNLTGAMRDKIQRDGAVLDRAARVPLRGLRRRQAADQAGLRARRASGRRRQVARGALPALRRRRPARHRWQGPVRHVAHRRCARRRRPSW